MSETNVYAWSLRDTPSASSVSRGRSCPSCWQTSAWCMGLGGCSGSGWRADSSHFGLLACKTCFKILACNVFGRLSDPSGGFFSRSRLIYTFLLLKTISMVARVKSRYVASSKHEFSQRHSTNAYLNSDERLGVKLLRVACSKNGFFH